MASAFLRSVSVELCDPLRVSTSEAKNPPLERIALSPVAEQVAKRGTEGGLGPDIEQPR